MNWFILWLSALSLGVGIVVGVAVTYGYLFWKERRRSDERFGIERR